ncbi:MAG: helicase-related protein [Candidatus Levybacteria bacterium]|nr:helicase-related protein [Candidatus Levybacteria bacterium]
MKIDVLVGTHAVLEKGINFDRLGLVVIDEQQRFGVEQRAIIRSKGKNPHLLTMTATPIPRTIALTLYGDLDLSLLDEMPHGRKLIKTWLVPPEKRDNAYSWIEKQIKNTKSQAFIVCPFIEESESLHSVKAASKEFENLKNNVFKNLKLGLLHGKMKEKDKEEVLEKFRIGKIDILVATPVVEVGIDIPNATIIMIEASERFGLAQLHQLRGRVGRGDKQSYCLLFTESLIPQTLERLKAMEKHNVGSELAELDLALRGPGEIYGTAQHGRKMLKIASFSDFELIKKVRREADKIFPNLKAYPKLLEKLKTVNLKKVSPD